MKLNLFPIQLVLVCSFASAQNQSPSINPYIQPQVMNPYVQTPIPTAAKSIRLNSGSTNVVRKSDQAQIFLGDRSEIAKLCPEPSGWSPKSQTMSAATEWHIVPYYVASSTYPRSGLGMHVTLSVRDPASGKDITNCDYIKVNFNGNSVNSVDFKKCPAIGLVSQSFRACLQYLESRK